MGFDSGSKLTQNTEDGDISLASSFQELYEWGHLETQTDEGAYTNIHTSWQTSSEATINEIIADVLETKNRAEIESDSDHEKKEPDKPTATNKKALENIDELKNYILTP